MSYICVETLDAEVIVMYDEAALMIKKYDDCKTNTELQELLEYRSKKGQLKFCSVGLSRLYKRKQGFVYVLKIRIKGFRSFKWCLQGNTIYANGIDSLPYVVALKMFVAMFDRIRYSQYIDNALPLDIDYRVCNDDNTVIGLVNCNMTGTIRFMDYR